MEVALLERYFFRKVSFKKLTDNKNKNFDSQSPFFPKSIRSHFFDESRNNDNFRWSIDSRAGKEKKVKKENSIIPSGDGGGEA